MRKYWEPPKVKLDTKSLKDINIETNIEYLNLQDSIFNVAKELEKQRDNTINEILNNMGITKEFISQNRDDFVMYTSNYYPARLFFYKDIHLFDEVYISMPSDQSFRYEYRIYFKGKIN